jgi:enamine deaminase RidA (YjgF/YER057c/UK114 family)
VQGLAGLIRAGPFLFTAGCDGHRDLATGKIDPALAGNAEAQCENAYGKIGKLLRQGNADFDNVVRIDHVTSSQDWLPRRQAIRGRLFGRPAPLASTGVAAKMHGINMLTTFVMAVADPADKEVLIPGARYGMNNISSAVRGGPLLFLAGIRGNVDPRTGVTVPEETDDAFPAQVRMCYDIIKAILGEVGSDAGQFSGWTATSVISPDRTRMQATQGIAG